MITIVIPETEYYNDETQTFFMAQETTLYLEHSLIAISKWEARYKVPFLKSIEHLAKPQHQDKFLYYVNCMSIKGDIPKDVLVRLDPINLKNIVDYISDPHSATVLTGGSGGNGRGPVITAERIYASMAGYRIPHEYAKWHINNLLMVINICAEMNEDPKKRKRQNPKEMTDAYYAQNEKLRKEGIPL